MMVWEFMKTVYEVRIQDGLEGLIVSRTVWEGPGQPERVQDSLEGFRTVWEGPGQSKRFHYGLGGSRTV